jgi:hypothetical protein
VHPRLLYGYWEITPESSRQAKNALGAEIKGGRSVVRMYDVSLIDFNGSNAHQVFDIDVGLEAPGWYIHLWSPDKSYVADLGFLARTGRFHAIVRSNTAHSPRTTISPRTDERWMRVPFSRGRKPQRARPLPSSNAPEAASGFTTEQLRLQSERVVPETSISLAEYLSGAPTSRRA